MTQNSPLHFKYQELQLIGQKIKVAFFAKGHFYIIWNSEHNLYFDIIGKTIYPNFHYSYHGTEVGYFNLEGKKCLML